MKEHMLKLLKSLFRRKEQPQQPLTPPIDSLWISKFDDDVYRVASISNSSIEIVHDDDGYTSPVTPQALSIFFCEAPQELIDGLTIKHIIE